MDTRIVTCYIHNHSTSQFNNLSLHLHLHQHDLHLKLQLKQTALITTCNACQSVTTFQPTLLNRLSVSVRSAVHICVHAMWLHHGSVIRLKRDEVTFESLHREIIRQLHIQLVDSAI